VFVIVYNHVGPQTFYLMICQYSTNAASTVIMPLEQGEAERKHFHNEKLQVRTGFE